MKWMQCSIIPDPYTGDDKCLSDQELLDQSMQKSAIGSLSNYIAYMYENRPAATSYFVADLGRTLGFMPKAYAQGIGFSGLSGLLPIWKAFRNIAYLLLTVVMVVIGFMVMLRKKIDPKTVVTVQNALPRIVVTLLLITFSYAIVGLMIDLMYLTMAVIINLVVNASGGILGPDTLSAYLGGGLKSSLAAMIAGGVSATNDFVSIITDIFAPWHVGPFLESILPKFLEELPKLAQQTILLGPTIIVGFLLAIVLLLGYVRLFFALLNAYIQIIIALLVGPLQILFDALPGGNGFASWMKNLVASLSAFPITAGMLLIGTYMTQLDSATPIWTPPFLSITGGGGTHAISGLIGLGVLMTIPSVINSVREALKAQPAINAGPNAIIGPMAGGLGQLFNLYYQYSFVTSAKRHKEDVRSPMQQAIAGQQQGLQGALGGGQPHQ